MSGAHDKTGVGGGSGEWETPDPFYEVLDRRFHFTYDPFASELNHKTSLFSTLDGTYRCSGDHEHEQISEHDGLNTNWGGQSVFCNPPYGRGLIEPCVRKMAQQMQRPILAAPAVLVALLPASTDARWFQNYVMPYAHVSYLPFRLSFVHPPFACGPKCQSGKTPHALGVPLANPPGAYALADYQPVWSPMS